MTCFFLNKYKSTHIKKAIKWVFKLALWLHHENTNLITTKISFQSEFTFKVEHWFIFLSIKDRGNNFWNYRAFECKIYIKI